jgi:glutamate formiminotransferase/formiminotetrahydrofolate cyclodeaminase
MAYLSATVGKYLHDAASDKPAPGGGSVAALVGALASAMGEMASNFTIGRKKFQDVEQQARQCLEQLTLARRKLLALMDADVEAYGAVSEAYALPRDSDEQKRVRTLAIQSALREAMKVPLNVMRTCERVAETSGRLVEIANPNLITDVGVSAILAEAACAAAALNVQVNLKYIRDSSVAEEVRPEMRGLQQTTERRRQEVWAAVQELLSS